MNGSSGSSGSSGSAGTSGTSAMAMAYAQMLFVDPNGNDSTALVGRLDRPWLTVSAAISAADGLSGDSTIHVWKGTYSETAYPSPGSGAAGKITLYLEAGVTIYASGAGANQTWIYSRIPFDIVGAGRDNSLIITGGGGAIYGDSGSKITLKNVSIRSELTGAVNLAAVHIDGASYLYIENSLVAQTSPTNGILVNAINVWNGSYLYAKGSTLLNYSGTPGYQISPGSANSACWVIYEKSGAIVSGRIRLHQTALGAMSSSGPCNIVGTSPGASGASILIDDIYVYIAGNSNVTHTLFNDSLSFGDNYYLGGTLVSAGDVPSPAGSWTVLSPGPAGTMAYFRQSNSIAPY